MVSEAPLSPSIAEIVHANATALLKRRLQIDPNAAGMDENGLALVEDDRIIRLQFEEAVQQGTRTKAAAAPFFAELDEKGLAVPVAALLLQDTFFTTALDALPEARTFLAKALL